ncbi:Dipeptidyl-peptidase IV [Purpureocillium takamizusanense]|uniref:Probable dipeptidyl-aminopeptidase B n=1 Tax=Purpureocillium takamizusanense TaxID=2060973 RepID=A0A9Q8V9D3_9HYPO|nr:Dipeptidyl-peptidase IV [Purpureocillium takamizusanense]UNI18125.1 Dipeptidyl-peptidase IV [Purpureocillium takamizusanense]
MLVSLGKGAAALLSLASWAAILHGGVVGVGAIEPPRHPHQPTGNGERLLTYNETVTTRKIRPSSISVRWTATGDDGQYITTNDKGDLVLDNIATNASSVFVPASSLPNGTREYWIRHDSRALLVAANATKQYRHSYFADYYILDVASGSKTPLVEDQAGDIQYAVQAPRGNAIAFVRGNNLYLRDGDGKGGGKGNVTQITSNGGPDMFNGVPDWVYEEEILGDRFALWFSPDAKYVAYLSFNETGVQTFTIPYYMAGKKVAPPYPRELELRYPKVGSKNPTVEFNVLDVEAKKSRAVPIDAFPKDEAIVGEVAWVTEGHSSVIYRAFNRVQDLSKHVVVDPKTGASKVVRERDGTDGWLENTLAMQYVGRIKGACNRTYYVDLSDESGWQHVYLYPTDSGGSNSKPIQLTSGDWEVLSILHVDAKRSLVYYVATTRHSTERHVYSVSWATKKVTPLVDDGVSATWTATFSSQGGYYILTYSGPDVPYQELYASNRTDRPLRTLVDNKGVYKVIDEYSLPNITYLELRHPDGFSLNVRQTLPPNFDPSKKYPVLFNPYGGPNSQQVIKEFQAYGWNAYIASEPELRFITYVVDNRGTGSKGRKFRSAVTGHLGRLEPQDQIWAARQLIASNAFIDAEHVGMWGWSFGGYLTAKTMEADSGVFTFGLSTAPVSDWRFYDSMYTERYMKTLAGNAAGYDETAVRKTDGFKKVAGVFSLMHGTGDDNVHFQNAAALVDVLVGGGVSPDKFRMMAFTDSDHGISYNGATAFLYKFLTARLWDEVQRKSGKGLVHQWSKKTVVDIAGEGK